jgi:hypothetical protein
MTTAEPKRLWGCASLCDCGWTGPQAGRNKEGTEFCPNCGGFVARRLSAPAAASLHSVPSYGERQDGNDVSAPSVDHTKGGGDA